MPVVKIETRQFYKKVYDVDYMCPWLGECPDYIDVYARNHHAAESLVLMTINPDKDYMVIGLVEGSNTYDLRLKGAILGADAVIGVTAINAKTSKVMGTAVRWIDGNQYEKL